MKASVKFIIGSAATIVLAFLVACLFASGICAAHTDGYVLWAMNRHLTIPTGFMMSYNCSCASVSGSGIGF